MAITIRQGNHPHVYWIDLKQNGILVECAVMKRDPFGNISFIEINKLDDIDRRRLLKILSNRNARSFELWDLMSQITLNNGVNALQYFHQLVRVLTPQGSITSPRRGEIGVGYVDINKAPPLPKQAEPAQVQQPMQTQTQVPVSASTTPSPSKQRGPYKKNTSKRSSYSRSKTSSKSTKATAAVTEAAEPESQEQED